MKIYHSRYRQIFFGRPDGWREHFLECSFMLQMHLNMTHEDIYRLPVKYRNWFIDRLAKHFKNKNEIQAGNQDAKPVNDGKSLADYEEMINKKFGI